MCIKAIVWLLQIVLAITTSTVQAGPISDVLGFGAKSGKFAKFDFRLRESSYVTSVAWSPDGRYIATSGIFSRYVHVWDLQKREVIKTFELVAANSNSRNLSWSHDSRYLAVCAPATLQVYRSSDWSEVVRFGSEDAGGCIRSVFSDDDTQLTILARYLKTFSVADWHPLNTVDLRARLGEGKSGQRHRIRTRHSYACARWKRSAGRCNRWFDSPWCGRPYMVCQSRRGGA